MKSIQNQNTLLHENKAIYITQDELYQFIKDNGITLSRIAELMGVGTAMVSACFLRHNNRFGKPRYFNDEAITKLNSAIKKLASLIKKSRLSFGSKLAYTTLRGNTFDPGMVPLINNEVGQFFNLRVFLKNSLGWNDKKKSLILNSPSGKIYGHVTQQDVNSINNEMDRIADALAQFVVIKDKGDGSPLTIPVMLTHEEVSCTASAIEAWLKAFQGNPTNEPKILKTVLDKLYNSTH